MIHQVEVHMKILQFIKTKLCSFNKENYAITEIKTEELEYVAMSSTNGIYQVENWGDYLYYTVGSQQGTLIVFYGKACRIKKDGTEYEELTTLGGERGVIPELLISNNYLYVEGCRVNLENNQKTTDRFKNGDKIDKEIIYI